MCEHKMTAKLHARITFTPSPKSDCTTKNDGFRPQSRHLLLCRTPSQNGVHI